jgi:hypothetical protein
LRAAHGIGGFAAPAKHPERKVLVRWAAVAGLLGLTVEVGPKWLRNTMELDVLRHGLAAALQVGGAILHVDHSPSTSDQWQGDHYVYAHRLEDERVLCCDPAGGQWLWLSAATLQAPCPHGSARPYRVRGVMPIRRGVL